MNNFNTSNGEKVKFVLLWMLLTLVCSPALAVDGAREISQACAATGCFSGDTAGFPVTISSGGAYVFTSNLDVTGEANPQNVTAVRVSASVLGGVVIDLNGFRILGTTFCPGTPPTTCSPTGTGNGVFSNANHITVKNGRISGMGSHGIRLVSGARVENMAIEDCAGDGIQAIGSGGLYLDNVVRRNGGRGIRTGSNALVRGNLIHANIGTGLHMSITTGYIGNVLSNNTAGDVFSGQNMGGNVCTTSLCP